MYDLPLDIVRLMSYELPIRTLSINKTFHSVYNKMWYQDYLEHNYTLDKHINNWKRAYYNSFKTGTIYRVNGSSIKKYPIEGIKAADLIASDKCLVLTFTGDLYCCDETTYELIAKDVIDIDHSYYITANKCYAHDIQWYQINVDDEFQFIKRSPHYIYVATKYKLYVWWNWNKNVHINFHTFHNGIIAMGQSSSKILVVDQMKRLYGVDLERIRLYARVDDFTDNVLTIKDKKYIIDDDNGYISPRQLDVNSCSQVIFFTNKVIGLKDGKMQIYEYIALSYLSPENESIWSVDFNCGIRQIFQSRNGIYVIK